jgi:hypothetical protein
MRKREVKKGLEELQTFLGGYNLTVVTNSEEFQRELAKVYKYYHALLVWQVVVKRTTPSHLSPPEYQDFCLFFDESLSDMCQSVFLWTQGLYKPCYLILRSSVENFFRVIGIYEHEGILNLKSTYELIDAIKSTPLVKQSSNIDKLFGQLHQDYKTLCQHVHTASQKQMSLTTAVGVFPKFDPQESLLASKQLSKIIKTYCAFLGFMFRSEYNKLHHSELDIISDILTASTRRELMT